MAKERSRDFHLRDFRSAEAPAVMRFDITRSCKCNVMPEERPDPAVRVSSPREFAAHAEFPRRRSPPRSDTHHQPKRRLCVADRPRFPAMQAASHRSRSDATYPGLQRPPERCRAEDRALGSKGYPWCRRETDRRVLEPRPVPARERRAPLRSELQARRRRAEFSLQTYRHLNHAHRSVP